MQFFIGGNKALVY